jgi:mRNA-degrading endonuclease toxin of MazEF toxin-antitoxin module
MNVGDIWFVDFPFEDDKSQSKERPCIIIDVDTLEVLSIKVTTHKPRDEYDIPIFKWREANLSEPSFARVSKTMAFSKNDFIRKIGELDLIDFRNIANAFKKFHS